MYKMGKTCREWQFQKQTENRTAFDREHEFKILDYEFNGQVSESTFIVRVEVTSRSRNILRAPEAGTRVKPEITLDKNFAPVVFQGVVMAQPPDVSEFLVTMLMTKTTGGSRFILQEKRGKFTFGREGVVAKRITRCIRGVMYGGNYIPPENWMKQVLLAHDAVPLPTQPPEDQMIEDYIDCSIDNSVQKRVVRRCIILGEDFFHRVTIIQDPSETGKI